MRIRNESPVHHRSIEVERPKPPPPPPPPKIEAKVDHQSVERAARRTSEFEVGTARRTGALIGEVELILGLRRS